jgi:hypothetical protein
MAAFPVDRAAAARLLPGGELHLLTLPGGRGRILLTQRLGLLVGQGVQSGFVGARRGLRITWLAM